MKFIIDYRYLIGYAIYCYIFAVIYSGILKDFKYGVISSIKALFLLIPATIILMWVMPFFWIVWFDKCINRIKIDTFTIHKLTEENKTTLRQLGFDERFDFVSRSNFSYAGFRKNVSNTIISVCYDGRVSINGDLTEEVKHIKKQIQNLPNEIKGEKANE